MISNFEAQYLLEDNTHNFAQDRNSHRCSRKRPCYREQICRFCRKRKLWFIRSQIITFIFEWDLEFFCTASIVGFTGHPQEGIQSLKVIRSFFHRKVFRKAKYISFIAIGERGADCFSPLYTPHFHVLYNGSMTKKQFRSNLVSAVPDFNWNVHVVPIRKTPQSGFRLATYLINNNYFPTLKFRPRKVRLISASKGMLTGRPKRLSR